MKIGILSDSHGRGDRVAEAVKRLVERGGEAIVHCGDLTTTDDVRPLGDAGVPAWLVAGNMDRDLESRLFAAARTHGVEYAVDFVALPLGGGEHLAATHGHLANLLEELIRGGQFRYVCHGHTHRLRDERIGDVRVLNPGALWHPKGRSECTCLLLDVDTDDVEELIIE
jgi:hypothetical protein